MRLIDKTILDITPVDSQYYVKARAVWDNLVHPIGSLGKLEELTIKIAGMVRSKDIDISKRALVVMCGDNGIFEEKVSSGYYELTSRLVEAMAGGHTGAAALCKDANTDLFVVDLGTRFEGKNPNIIKHRHRSETSNFMKEPAMTLEETIDCIEVGIRLTDDLIDKGYKIVGTGELGIANTTTSSAVMSALTNYDGAVTVGLGAGIDEESVRNKIRVVDESVKKYDLRNKSALEALQCVGGYDIAGIVGVFLSCAKNRVPAIIDGFISAVAALVAVRLNPDVKGYLIASHMSCEKQVELLFDELEVSPMLTMDMRLGEGSGCPLAIKVLDSAVFAMNNMGKFDEVSIMGDVLVNIREEERVVE